MSSEDESRESSPLAGQLAEPQSSPVQPSSPDRPSSPPDPPSSPISEYESSSKDSSSSSELQPPRKRKKEPGTQLGAYWRPDSPHPQSEGSASSSHLSVHEEQDGSTNHCDNSNDHQENDSESSSSITSSSSRLESSDSSCDVDSEPSVDSDQGVSGSASSICSESDGCSDDSAESADDSLTLKVWEGSELTVDEGVLSLMEIFLKYSVNKQTMGAFLKSLLKFIPELNNMPQDQYNLFKYVYDLCPLPQELVHFYCKKCQYYLGLQAKQCPSCGSLISNRYFQLSLEHQIKNLFENHYLADYIDNYKEEKEKRSEAGKYFDICDGSEYKRTCIPGEYNLSLIGHLDGVSVTESSNVSLWPIEYFICEIPPNFRFKFLLVNGVWLDDAKPNFNTYYGPFAEEGRRLHERGVTWVHPRTKSLHNSRITISAFCVDGPVRAQVQNIQCIGGKHCCNTCEQKMLKLPAQPVLPGVVKKNRKRIFDFKENPPVLRTSKRMHAHGQVTVKRKVQANGGKFVPKKGVFGPSVASKLHKFDRSTGVFAEYMHLLLGIVKQFMELWFESDSKSPYSLKTYRDEINSFLLSIKVPDYVTRIPRSTESYSKWKANELRSFLLYYSAIILSQFMKENYFNHWMLFVCSLHILLNDAITENDILKAETMLRLFIRNFAALYKSESLTYNLHSLLHLPLTVRRWGNLQFISAFQFESFNGGLARCIHGSKNQGKELTNNVRLMCGVGVLKARVECARTRVHANVQHASFSSKIKSYFVTPEQQQLLDDMGVVPQSFYYRCSMDNEIYTSSIYLRQVKRNNYTISFVDESDKITYGNVDCFLESEGGDLLAFVVPFFIEHMRYFINEETAVVAKHIVPIRESNNVVLISVKNIIRKVIRVGQFICLRPNTYEVNL